MIKFYSKTGRYSYIVDGKTLATSNDKKKLEAKIRTLGKTSAADVDDDVLLEVKKSEFTVAERFDFMTQFTKLAAKGIIPSLVVTGSGGLGKSFTVLNALRDMGLTEDTIGTMDGDFVFVKGYTTPRNLYTTLFHENGKVIVLDDLDTAFRDPIGASILKAALDSSDRRIISWEAESKDDEVPSRFEFTGKIIFISNLELHKFPQAILSRSIVCDLTLNVDEKIERIAQIFDEDERFESEDKIDVLNFIRKHVKMAKDLNIRSALNILKMKVALGEDWERPCLYNFSVNG